MYAPPRFAHYHVSGLNGRRPFDQRVFGCDVVDVMQPQRSFEYLRESGQDRQRANGFYQEDIIEALSSPRFAFRLRQAQPSTISLVRLQTTPSSAHTPLPRSALNSARLSHVTQERKRSAAYPSPLVFVYHSNIVAPNQLCGHTEKSMERVVAPNRLCGHTENA